MALWILLLALTAYAGGLGTGWPLLQHVGYALGTVLTFACLLTWMAHRGLTGSVTVDRSHATAGDEVEETITLRKHGLFPALWTSVETPPHGTRSFLGLWSGEERSWQRTRVFLNRGRYSIGGDLIRVHDPFGLVSRVAARLEPIDVTIYPRPIRVPEAVRAVGAIGSSRISRRVENADGTISDLRAYAIGDSPSRIHWRSTARVGTLMVTDSKDRGCRAIWLAVDLGGGEDAAERTSGITAFLAHQLADSGWEVGALVVGRERALIPPKHGMGGATRILEALARMEATPHSELARLVRQARRCESADALILISPSPVADDYSWQLRRIVRAVNVVPSSASQDDG